MTPADDGRARFDVSWDGADITDFVVDIDLGSTRGTFMLGHPPLPDGRVDYCDLTDAQREAIHAWCRLHRITLEDTPINALIEYDPVHDEWRVEQYRRRGGRFYLIGHGAEAEVASCVIRRQRKADLPWPVVG